MSRRARSTDPTSRAADLEAHRERLLTCRLCPAMIGPVVAPPPVASKVMLLGQAPGRHEGRVGRPFGWTAGKTLFRWLESMGVGEEDFRSRVYMAAVCRCFPGKTRGGGDRVPAAAEIQNCSRWLESELALLRPELLIPVGRLAMAQVLADGKLTDLVGHEHRVRLFGQELDAIPLPHPSGVSSWHKTEPGRSLLGQALTLLTAHAAFRSLFPHAHPPTKKPRRGQ